MNLQIIQSIQNRIYDIRGQRVMLDFDLARLYEVETKVLNQAVKRNVQRFPADFMFQLTAKEYDFLKAKLAALETEGPLKSQIVTSKGRGGNRYLPFAFTEQGVAMLSGVLNSDKAIQMNIAIMRTFIEIRRVHLKAGDVQTHLKAIIERLGEHDVQISQIYDAMENLLDEKAGQKKWEERERIGFKSKKPV